MTPVVGPRSVLVVTVVHDPRDSRIRVRQIGALLRAGWRVTYAAPFTAYGLPVPGAAGDGVAGVDLPRASGRRRVTALRAARNMLRRHGPGHDLVLLHDPELLPAAAGLRLPPLVWDVHEDTAAALEVRPWVPGPLRRPAAALVRRVERLAERRVPLLLADEGYAARFAGRHPVVPNGTRVPADPPPAATPGPDGVQRVVYLGSVTIERGACEMAEVGRILRERTQGAVALQVIGPAHGPARGVLERAAAAGDLAWPGFVPAEQAGPMLQGALAGLSLLRDEANFRPSMPTKVVDYLARGVPVVSTPLPVARRLVERSGGGVVVPFRDPEAAAEAVLALAADPERARAMGRAGHAVVVVEHNWDVQEQHFVAALEGVVVAAASSGEPDGPTSGAGPV